MKIVRLDGTLRFKARDKDGYYCPTGYCLMDEKGFITLNANSDTPYVPIGGRKALKSILDAGGFVGDYFHVLPIN